MLSPPARFTESLAVISDFTLSPPLPPPRSVLGVVFLLPEFKLGEGLGELPLRPSQED